MSDEKEKETVAAMTTEDEELLVFGRNNKIPAHVSIAWEIVYMRSGEWVERVKNTYATSLRPGDELLVVVRRKKP